jgi:hypothetical protein
LTAIGLENRKIMTKKTKTPKPLPSALTVASPVETTPQISKAQSIKTSSAAAETVKPVPQKPKSIPTPETSSAKPSAPLIVVASAQNRVEKEKVPLPKASQTVQATFVLVQPQANEVCLCGEFNAWSPDATPLNRQEDGQWIATLALQPGRYEYKFVVDGQWMPDLNAQENVLNEHGSLNSVIEVRA